MSPGALATNAASPTAAVLRNRDAGPMRVDRLPYDLRKIRRDFQRLQATAGRVRACDEASGPCSKTSMSLTSRRRGVNQTV